MNHLNRILTGALLLCLSACSSFNKEWREAGRTAPADRFSGQWEGRWTSSKHKNAGGRLLCVLQKRDSRTYRAHFKANWMIFTSTYVVALEAQQRGGVLHFKGAENLGRLYGGVYRYEGRATPQQFHATYDSSYDIGAFTMSRRLTSTGAIP